MKAKKSLGQHFLTSKGAVLSMIEASNIIPTDTIIEIGPGRGFLTVELLKTGAHIIAIEKDSDLIPYLSSEFEPHIRSGKLTLVEGDIRMIDEEWIRNNIKNPYKVVANIPYYITSMIIEQFLTLETQPSLMTLLVQKEVAERIVARDEKESILSLSVKAFGIPKYIQTVRAGSFAPPPKVDSAILLINEISRERLPINDEEGFFKLVKSGFSSKRKQLKGNIEKVVSDPVKLLASCNIDEKARAEDLTLDQWLCLLKKANLKLE